MYKPEKSQYKSKPVSEELETINNDFEFDITIHIFTVSATLVGVCLTVIGIFFMSRRLSHVKTFGEVLVAFDALLFLAACFISYTALRVRRKKRRRRQEQLAEEIFFIALAFMVYICGFIIYELA